MQGRRLYDAIESLGVSAVSLRVFRHISEGRDCLSGEGARRFGGRWNPPGTFPTLYTSLSLEGAIAELDRLMRRQRRTTQELLPRRICEIGTRLTNVLDLTHLDSLAAVGLSTAGLRRNNLGPCQRAGQAAHQLGVEALLVPSATRVANNLVIFPANVRPDSSLTVSRTYSWPADRPPA